MADALPVWSVFQVDRTEDAPMQEQIAAFFRRAIADGRLGPGARLPSTRSLAEQMVVARNTVSLAYERLAAEGYVEGRRGGCTRVARDLPDLTPNIPATAACSGAASQPKPPFWCRWWRASRASPCCSRAAPTTCATTPAR